jgi:hypothetical protein
MTRTIAFATNGVEHAFLHVFGGRKAASRFAHFDRLNKWTDGLALDPGHIKHRRMNTGTRYRIVAGTNAMLKRKHKETRAHAKGVHCVRMSSVFRMPMRSTKRFDYF